MAEVVLRATLREQCRSGVGEAYLAVFVCRDVGPFELCLAATRPASGGFIHGASGVVEFELASPRLERAVGGLLVTGYGNVW